MEVSRQLGIGVIWDGIPLEAPAIPAKAGMQSVERAFAKVCGVDSRSPASAEDKSRGNDCDLRLPCLANDAGTVPPANLDLRVK
jgi:hypothetical protein